MNVKTRKKLIEVALPLEAINIASAREKSIRHGHPSTLHLWWARRPLAAARVVIFAQMVDDPSSVPELFPTAVAQERERDRLFRIIENLVKWKNTTNEAVLEGARNEIWQSWRRTCADNADHPQAAGLFDPHHLPPFCDPFAGGGAIPLEAQRLGLETFASDLNPVAVLINKAMIEIPPRFAGSPSVNPTARDENTLTVRRWSGAQGLAEDVRYYGQWVRTEAEKRIGHLYPQVEVTAEVAKSRPDLKSYVGKKLTVIAWIWARTIRSSNPAFSGVEVPLASTFMLCTKSGKEVYVEPVVDNGIYHFTVKVGQPSDVEATGGGTKLGRGANFRCVMSGIPLAGDYIKGEGREGRMGTRLMAIVAEGNRGRVYLAPTPEQESTAKAAHPEWKPEGDLPTRLTGGTCVPYGLATWADLFTSRQLAALTTFSDLIGEAISQARSDALLAGLPKDSKPLDAGGDGAEAYGQAVGMYLAFALDKVADRGSSLGRWDPTPTQSGIINTFSRQALPMTWDFAESNPLGDASGNYLSACDLVAKSLLCASQNAIGHAWQGDARSLSTNAPSVISTDPPYYDNIFYADLSDFFYVWLRRSLRAIFPELFATLAVPKSEELVATSHRHGSAEKAESFFLEGMTQAMNRLSGQAHPSYPTTIYYAFKQSERENAQGVSSTGWETFLGAVIRAGLTITGTWPMRTELSNRMIGSGTNALASSIVLVCHRAVDRAPTATRREFVATLKRDLPEALRRLQAGNIAPVDLAQAAIGPGMAIYTRYAKVLDAEGNQVPVREALALINKTLDDALAEQEGDFDADSRWALTWFEEYGFAESEFGIANLLSTAKATSVEGLAAAGIIQSKRGKVRLLRPAELPPDWDPATDRRLTAWEMVHQLIRALDSGGEASAARLVAKLGSKAEVARELAYRLYTIAERKKRAAEALAYNGLVQSWPEIIDRVREGRENAPAQADLFGAAES